MDRIFAIFAAAALLLRPLRPSCDVRPVGYEDLEDAERDAVDRAVRWMIERQWRSSFDGYGTSLTMFALPIYLSTDGPNDVGG